MDDLTPKYQISIDEARRELHHSASGQWDEENTKRFLFKMAEKAAPFLCDDKPFSTLADFTNAIVQSQETAEIIRKNVEKSKQFGLERIAVVGASALVRLQYKRLNESMEVEFFDSKHEALLWLHAQR